MLNTLTHSNHSPVHLSAQLTLGSWGLGTILNITNLIPNSVWAMLSSALIVAFSTFLVQIGKAFERKGEAMRQNEDLKMQMAEKNAQIGLLTMRINDGEASMRKMDMIMRKQESSEHRVLSQVVATKAVVADTNAKVSAVVAASSDEIPVQPPKTDPR